MKFSQEGYDKWVDFRQYILRENGKGNISNEEMFKILGNRFNMGKGSFFVGAKDNRILKKIAQFKFYIKSKLIRKIL